MKLTIQEIINSGANVSVTVNVNELREVFFEFQEQAKVDAARQLANNPDDIFYTPEVVMSILSISRMTLWRWKQPDKNYLVPIKIGGLDRYRKSDIDKILQIEQ